MKTLAKYVVILLASLVLFACILELAFTYYYKHPKNYLDKFTWVESMSKEAKYDYLVLGSSRAFDHVDPTVINDSLNIKGLNLGYYAYGPFENKIIVKQAIEKQLSKTVLIQVDYTFNDTLPTKIARESLLPYIHNSIVSKEFKRFDSEYFNNFYIPFYRYIKNDSYIGFRNIFTSFFGKNRICDKTEGYHALKKVIKKDKPWSYNLSDQANVHFNEIIKMCKKNNVELYFFTAPLYRCTSNNEIISHHLPNYIDFSNKYEDKEYFNDNKHLNHKGAQVFSLELARNFLTKKTPR